MNCDLNLYKIFVFNLIIFCTFFVIFLPLSCNCAVYLCIVALECSCSNWPYVARPRVNKLNWMQRYSFYTQKQILTLNNFLCNNYNLLYVVPFVSFYMFPLIFIISVFLLCSCAVTTIGL